MSKYRIRIEEGGYRDVLDLSSNIEPDVIDKIILEIYTILKHASETQSAPQVNS